MKKVMLVCALLIFAAFLLYDKAYCPDEMEESLNLLTPTETKHAGTVTPVHLPTPLMPKTWTPVPAKENKKTLEIRGLVEIPNEDGAFVIDLKYATKDNFMGKKIYTRSKCIIHKNTLNKLVNANKKLNSLGYKIKILDAYRPYSAQKILWDAASDKSYVASPKNGSIHNRGAAVDITLTDQKGIELKMPSGYDEFSKRAHIDYRGCTEEEMRNRELLGKIMVESGFKRIKSEWWHFEDTEGKKYPLLDIPFERF
ncbi:MAG: D-alanyl-D-alanine dipeptidase [Clostridia bacterium]|nr:D-alanyl-D-alanine dipeptidase [Clostridia bacterium]